MQGRMIFLFLTIFLCINIFPSSSSISASTHQASSSTADRYVQLQHPKGWHLFNNTLTHITIDRVVDTLSVPTEINSGENAFLVMSHHDTPITIKREKPQPLHVSSGGRGFPAIHQAENVDCEYLVIQENELGSNGRETFDIIPSSSSFLLANRTDSEKVYYAWYDEAHRITLPREVGEYGHCAPIYPPLNAKKLSLVINFVQAKLENKKQGSSSLILPFKKLEGTENKEIILVGGEDESLDLYDTRSNLTVINTTNIPLYCALFLYQNSQAKKRIGSVCHILKPQRRTLIPRSLVREASKKKDSDSRLVASKDRAASVQDLLEDATAKKVAIYELSSNGTRCLLITTDLKNDDCNFNFVPFGLRSPNILPYIFTAFTPSQRLFSAGTLAQVEKSIPTFVAPNLDGKDRDTTRDLIEGVIGDFPREKTFNARRSERVWEGIIKLMGGRGKVRTFLEECGIKLSDKYEVTEYLKKNIPTPKIAFVSTGGGYRAMIETLGFLEGAEANGILDCCTIMTGLSGSTWAMSSLVASGLPVHKFVKDMRKKVYIPIDQSLIVTKSGHSSLRQLLCNVASDASYIRRTLNQSRFNQPQGLVGFYGHALANALLDGAHINNNDKHDITFSDLQVHLQDARYPLPICVAVESKEDTNNRKWLEFSPYYVGTYKVGIHTAGNVNNGICIETENFGSLYKDDRLVQHSPEYPLAQLMGIWGSAFALSISDIQERLSPASSAFLGAIESFDRNFAYCYRALFPRKDNTPAPSRFAVGEVPSFLYVSDNNAQGSHQMREADKQFLIDGGISLVQGNTHNFATIPALVRGAEILILCDCTKKPNEEIPQHLLASQKEAANLQLPFPKISEENKEDLNSEYKLSTVLTGKDTPTVIYMRGKKSLNKELNSSFDPDPKVVGFTESENFSYKPAEYDALKEHARKIMQLTATRDSVIEAIKELLKKHINNVKK